MPAAQVPVSTVDHIVETLRFFAGAIPGEQGAELRAALDAAKADEVFIADIWPIIEDAIEINKPIVARFMAALKRKAARG
jgi:hypothetical protein